VQEVQEPVDGYGRVELFLVVDADFLQEICEAGNVIPPLDPVVLAAVSPIPHLKKHNDANIIEYKLLGQNLGGFEIVDATDIDCLIGRYKTPQPSKAQYIVDRTTIVGRMDMLDDTVHPD
jgi:hypothetical protein